MVNLLFYPLSTRFLLTLINPEGEINFINEKLKLCQFIAASYNTFLNFIKAPYTIIVRTEN